MSEYCGQCGAKLDSNGYCQICRVTRQANIPTPKEPAVWFDGQHRKPVRETFWAREIIGEGIFLLILSIIGFFIYAFNGMEEMEGAEWWLHIIIALVVFCFVWISVARHMINLQKAEDIEAIRAMLEAQSSEK